MSVYVQVEETINLDSNAMQVVCDPSNSRLRAIEEKLESFYNELDEDERSYISLVAEIGDLELAQDGTVELLEGVRAHEDRIRDLRSESEFDPQLIGTILATYKTIRLRC